jgi:drug/metabolite transporter (DMT)-like permease
MKTLAWALFWLIALIWGSSFMLIRIGVEAVPIGQLVFIRTLIAAVGLTAVMLLRGKRFPRSRRAMFHLAVIGIVNGTLPYAFIAWGEQSISSSLASVIQATVPMFSLVIAHFTLTDEKMSPARLLGLLLGFLGVVVLVSRPDTGQTHSTTLIGGFLIVLASLCYASGTIYARRSLMGEYDPIVISAGSFIASASSALILMLIEPALGGAAPVDLLALPPAILWSVLALGFFNTFIAYMFFYYVVQQLGAFRTSVVTYFVPVVAIFLGWLVLDETIDVRFLFGAALIFAGLAVINVRVRWLMRRLRPAV